ncbi:MAG: choice-of-anchor D domain-containing protein, partial [Candidatus Cloacimonadaceae bacterium]|nr:choice-of-anchor D domain-containing protein [Candidatus Cloacimonadaceae bacterium]
IGAGNQLALVPVDMYYQNSLFETLYYPHEIGHYGTIKGISFYNNFITDLPGKPTRIWMGQTEQADLNPGWIDASQLSLVYDGQMDYPSGENTIWCLLHQPYDYTSGNLVLLVQRPMDTSYYNTNDRFYSQTAGTDRSRRVWSDTVILDPYAPVNIQNTSSLNAQFPKTTFLIESPTLYIPPAAVNVSPLDGSTGISPDVSLQWTAGAGNPSDGFRVSFGTDNPPSNVINGLDVGTATAYDIDVPLLFGTTYYWQIVPSNASGHAQNCPVWSFSTFSAHAPQELSATAETDHIHLAWQAPAYRGSSVENHRSETIVSRSSKTSVDSYDIVNPASRDFQQISGYQIFKNDLLLEADFNGTAYSDFAVEHNQTYSYYIVANYDLEQSPPSNTVSLLYRNLPEISLSEVVIDFETVYIGESKVLGFDITNTGVSLLEISSIDITADDILIEPSSINLIPNESTRITLTYAPTQVGGINTSLQIHSNAWEANLVELPVLAQSFDPPIISLSTDTLQPWVLGEGLHSEIITISNIGGSDLTFLISTSPPWLWTNPSSGLLAPDQSAQITVFYQATDLNPGYHNATLFIDAAEPIPAGFIDVTMLYEKFNFTTI